jgi:hypothetical protein
MCEPWRLTTTWASTACYRDSFTFYVQMIIRQFQCNMVFINLKRIWKSNCFLSLWKLKNLICVGTCMNQRRSIETKAWYLTLTATGLVVLQQEGWGTCVRSVSQVQWLIFHFLEESVILRLRKYVTIHFLIKEQHSTLVSDNISWLILR